MEVIIYYDKKLMNQTIKQSEDTIPMTDALMADYREYSANLQDKSLELVQEVGQVPYLVKYKLDENGNRYSHYLDTVDADGYRLPDTKAIALKEQEAELANLRADRDSLLATVVDHYQKPLVWEELTAEQQELVRVYRQALLDCTDVGVLPEELVI